jgi:Flp pilus assembly protein TadD
MHKIRLNQRSTTTANLLKNDTVLSPFKHKISDSLLQSLQDQTILFMPLDEFVYMLVIPPTFNYSQEETEQVAKEIQQGILPSKHNDEPYHILTWRQIVNENHLQTSCPTWKMLHNGHFAANTQLIFFVNIEHARTIVQRDATQAGYAANSQYGNQVVSVSNGEFEENINLLSLAARSLWMAEELTVTIQASIRALPSEFRFFYSALRLLKKTYPDASFWRENGQLHVMHNRTYGSIDYRAIAKSIQFSKQSAENWISHLTLSDLLNIDKYPILSIRSHVFPKARPESMHQIKDGFVLVVETSTDQRLFPISMREDELKTNKIQYFLDESVRHIGNRDFSSHVYIHNGSQLFSAVFIGDQIASIATHPSLIYGAIQGLGKIPNIIRILSNNEDTIIVVDQKVELETIDLLRKKADHVLETLHPDGSDALELDCNITIPDFPCGRFTLHHIPSPYFELIDTANDEKITLPPGRADYLRGLAFELIHQWELAIQAFRRAYSFDAADGDISYALGRAMSELGQFENSLTFLERAFALLPEDPDVANSLGIAYLESGQKENSIRVLEHAVNMQPDDAQFLFNLGRCYLENQKLNEAEVALTKALKYVPNFPEAHATLAKVRWRLGDINSAKKHARKAFAASPSNKYVQDLLWALSMDEDENG